MVGTLQVSRALADQELADAVLEQGIQNALALLLDAEHRDIRRPAGRSCRGSGMSAAVYRARPTTPRRRISIPVAIASEFRRVTA